jgi:hypothetical protein
MVMLYESADGGYFMRKLDEAGEHIVPIALAAAGQILALETKRHMAKIFQRKLEAPARATIAGKRFDTTRDELVWSDSSDDVEAAAVYRTAKGDRYLRLVNPWRDIVVMIKTSDWEELEEFLELWLCCDRSFLTMIDWETTFHVSSAESADSNDESYDVEPWLPRKAVRRK